MRMEKGACAKLLPEFLVTLSLMATCNRALATEAVWSLRQPSVRNIHISSIILCSYCVSDTGLGEFLSWSITTAGDRMGLM